jgi:hypothetical protein
VRARPLLLALVVLAAGCGSTTPPETRSGNLLGEAPSGWRSVPDPPGIAELAPDLSGLDVRARVDSPALVRAGDAVRTTAFVLASEEDAVAALARARASAYAALLLEELHGSIRRVPSPGAGYRLSVGRPAEPGRDTVELYALRRGRVLVLVELVSAAGFDPGLRDRILDHVSR